MMKVMIVQEEIPHYRVPVFDELGKRVELTVVFSKGDAPSGVSFQCKKVETFRFKYVFHKKSIWWMARGFDAVIYSYGMGFFCLKPLAALPRKYKLIYWSIGVSASYAGRYDADQNWAENFKKRIEKGDAVLFYSDYPIKKYIGMGVDPKKMFVANNTVRVLPCADREKDSILFIGSLYKQKKIDILLEAYKEAYSRNKDVPKLVIIGDGNERSGIEKWISDQDLGEKIHLTGSIFDDEALVPYFEKAIMCVSPDQAGLSVLKSMGYGVPYVTHRNAITGGEIFNIKNGENGILMEDFNELPEIILEAAENKERFRQMGQAAKLHYDTERTVGRMVDGFCEAINYAVGT